MEWTSIGAPMVTDSNLAVLPRVDSLATFLELLTSTDRLVNSCNM